MHKCKRAFYCISTIYSNRPILFWFIRCFHNRALSKCWRILCIAENRQWNCNLIIFDNLNRKWDKPKKKERWLNSSCVSIWFCRTWSWLHLFLGCFAQSESIAFRMPFCNEIAFCLIRGNVNPNLCQRLQTKNLHFNWIPCRHSKCSIVTFYFFAKESFSNANKTAKASKWTIELHHELLEKKVCPFVESRLIILRILYEKKTRSFFIVRRMTCCYKNAIKSEVQ